MDTNDIRAIVFLGLFNSLVRHERYGITCQNDNELKAAVRITAVIMGSLGHYVDSGMSLDNWMFANGMEGSKEELMALMAEPC